jgi:hypothetical protein
MRELFIQNSILDGSLTGNRFVNAAEAPHGPEQHAEKPKEKATSLPQTPERAVRETRVEGRKAIRKAKVIEMPEVRVTPRTPQEIAKDQQKAKETNKLFNSKEFSKITETTPNDSSMRELETELYTELPNKLAKRLVSQLENMNALHLPPEQFQKIADQVYKIVDDYVVEQDEKRASRAISQLYQNPEAQALVANKGVLPLLNQKEGVVADVFGPSTDTQEASAAIASRKVRKTSK